MSELRIIVLISSLVAAAAFGLIANIVHFKIWHLVDLKEPGRFGSVGWYVSKTFRLHRSYRAHYPEGNLVRFFYLLGMGGSLSIMTAAAALGFFNLH